MNNVNNVSAKHEQKADAVRVVIVSNYDDNKVVLVDELRDFIDCNNYCEYEQAASDLYEDVINDYIREECEKHWRDYSEDDYYTVDENDEEIVRQLDEDEAWEKCWDKVNDKIAVYVLDQGDMTKAENLCGKWY